jgi:hypothetical protein
LLRGVIRDKNSFVTADKHSTSNVQRPTALANEFPLLSSLIMRDITNMKTYARILLSILVAAICTSAFAAEPTPQSCKKSGKNCPMNDNKACNCGKKCSC